MGYSAEIYQKAAQILERRRADAESTAAMHRAEVYAAVPQMQQLDALCEPSVWGRMRSRTWIICPAKIWPRRRDGVRCL